MPNIPSTLLAHTCRRVRRLPRRQVAARPAPPATEQALQSANDRLSLALEALDGFIYHADLSDQRVERSAGLAKVLGFHPGDVQPTMAWWQAQIHPDDYVRATRQARESRLATDGHSIEYRARHRDGHYVTVWDRARVLRDAAGAERWLVGTTVNISERSQIEAALRRSEERFRAVQDLSLDGLNILRAIYDAQGQVVDFEYEYINPTAERLVGISNADLAGKRMREIFPGALETSFFQRYLSVAQTGEPQDFESYFEAEGISGWFRNLVYRYGDGIIIAFTDISARKAAEAERVQLLAREQAARTEAQEAVRVRDAFLSIAAHELRNPLTTLLGSAEALQRRMRRAGTLAERDDATLALIASQARRLNQMIGDLLDSSRLERGQLQIERHPVNLVALARRVCQSVRAGLGSHTIELSCPRGALVVDGDELRLEQVLHNLLGNAIKYSPGGQVRVRVERRPGRAVVAVADEGVGIAPEVLPQLFQRFFRADDPAVRQASGVGVGLYVVKEIVTLHGGDVSVASRPGAGSTFSFWLPVRAEAAPAATRTE